MAWRVVRPRHVLLPANERCHRHVGCRTRADLRSLSPGRPMWQIFSGPASIGILWSTCPRPWPPTGFTVRVEAGTTRSQPLRGLPPALSCGQEPWQPPRDRRWVGPALAATVALSLSGCGGGQSQGRGQPTLPRVIATARRDGWQLSARRAGATLRVQVTTPDGRLLPNYCGGPSFAVAYIDSRGAAVAVASQPLPQYCIAGGAATQEFDFPVPRRAGFYRVEVTVRFRAGGRRMVIPPTLEIEVGRSGLAPLP